MDVMCALIGDIRVVAHFDDIHDLPAHFFLELRGFFEDYKRLEQKTVLIDQFQGRLAAHDIVQASIALHQYTFRR